MLYNGEIIDHTYQIMQKIGSGGTGDVYLAYHIRLQKYVVVKKVKDNYVGQVNVRAEADILKHLKHTYLPQVYDFVQRERQVYTVMDYIEGCDMESYIQSGCLMDENILIKWLRQLCEVLEYLHSRKPPIIHSDIKPANIMITKEGNICLIDFNISLDGDDSSQISGISLPYASPEQYDKAVLYRNGQEHRHIILDGRTDMYSLGATFYSLITGYPPAGPYERNIPLTGRKISYSEGLAAVIDKSMAPERSGRYENMGQMLKAVNTMYKKTRQYKLYLAGVLSLIFLYVTAMCLGIGCMIYGYGRNLAEAFDKSSERLQKYYAAGDYENALDEGYAILNNNSYDKLLSKNSTDKILIFHTIGECYFEYEDYENAVVWYGKAVDNISDSSRYADYYRDYIVALVRGGSLEEAKQQLGETQEQWAGVYDIDLVNAEISVYEKDYSEAMKQIDRLAVLNIDEETKLHLLVLGSEAASLAGDCEKQIDYLEQAEKLSPSAGILRKLGNACISAVNGVKISEKNKIYYYQKAEQCYLDLSEKSYASLNDYLNLAICYRALGNYRDSILLLKELSERYSDYRIYMHLAFAYDKSGDAEHALKYAEECLVLYSRTPEGNRESEGTDNMQSLKELEKKYK